MTSDERAHAARQELVRILGAVICLAIVAGGVLAWRALDALAAGDKTVATAGALAGALTMGRED